MTPMGVTQIGAGHPGRTVSGPRYRGSLGARVAGAAATVFLTARVLEVIRVDASDEQEDYRKVASTVVGLFLNGLAAEAGR